MSDWIPVCRSADLLPGEHKVVWDGDTAIAVFNIDGEFYAIEDVCTTTAASWPRGRCTASRWSACATVRASTCAPAPRCARLPMNPRPSSR